jgi:hypothetical protein
VRGLLGSKTAGHAEGWTTTTTTTHTLKKNEYKEEEELSLKQIRNGRWRARILKNETDPLVVLAKNTDPNSFHSFLFYPLRNKALNPPTSYRPTPSEECEGVAKK